MSFENFFIFPFYISIVKSNPIELLQGCFLITLQSKNPKSNLSYTKPLLYHNRKYPLVRFL